MRVALVHDWLTGMRGGERVLERMIELYPDAEIHTLLHLPGSVSDAIEACPIHTTFVQGLPGRHQVSVVPPRLPVGRRATFSERLRSGDLKQPLCRQVGSHGVHDAPSVLLPHTDALRLGSVRRLLQPRARRHRPLRGNSRHDRVATALGCGYSKSRRRLRGQLGLGRRAHFAILRPQRHRRTAAGGYRVLRPGRERRARRLLSGGLGAVSLQAQRSRRRGVQPHAASPRRGRHRPRRRTATALSGPTIEMRGRIDATELRGLYQRCRGVVLAAVEDAGIVPIEAMACGRPPVVLARGGASEPIGDGVTGTLIREQTPEAVIEAIDRAEATPFNIEEIRASAWGTLRIASWRVFQRSSAPPWRTYIDSADPLVPDGRVDLLRPGDDGDRPVDRILAPLRLPDSPGRARRHPCPERLRMASDRHPALVGAGLHRLWPLSATPHHRSSRRVRPGNDRDDAGNGSVRGRRFPYPAGRLLRPHVRDVLSD